MEKRASEFQILEKQALGILTDETEPNEDYTEGSIYISSSPSFGDYTSWRVFADTHKTRFLLRRTVWQRIYDVQRFSDPLVGLKYGWNTDPTISVTIIELPSTRTAELLSRARSFEILEIGLDIRIKHAIVLDGTRWFVFVSNAFGNKSYLWNAVPPEWKPVVTWTEQTIAFLDSVNPN